MTAEPQGSFPTITQADLSDQKLFRLNNALAFLASQIASVQGATGPIQFRNTVKGSAFLSDLGAQIPTDPTQLLTKGAADLLYASGVRRTLATATITGGGGGGGTSFGSTVLEASDFCGGAGLSEACINAAIDAAPAAGASIHCRSGDWTIGAPINMHRANIRLFGDGDGTVFMADPAATFGSGIVRVTAGSTQIDSLSIDGGIVSSTQILYADLFGAMGGDPAHPNLANKTPIWISNGVDGFSLLNMTVRRCGGYAVLADARNADLNNIFIQGCMFVDNIAIVYGDATYPGNGSWTGGIFFLAGGGGFGDFRSINCTVDNCTFKNITGNALWSHTYSLATLHQNHNFTNNTFSDIGRDAIQYGGVIGGACSGNTGGRIGYVAGHPSYYPNQYAVGIDTSGYARGVNYAGNNFTNVNGGIIDLDGFLRGNVISNSGVISEAGDPDFIDDEILSYGILTDKGLCNTSGTNVTGSSGSAFSNTWNGLPIVIAGVQYTVSTVTDASHLILTGSAGVQTGVFFSRGTASTGKNITKGINCNNSVDPIGAQNILISGNTLRNMGNTAIGLYNTQNCYVIGNNIYHPADAFDAPISLGCTGDPRVCKNNTVTKNNIFYDCGGNQYCIYETDSLGANVGPNFINLNNIGGFNRGEYLPSPNSTVAGSRSSITQFTNSALIATPINNLISFISQTEGVGATAAWKLYQHNLGTGVAKLCVQVAGTGPILSVSDNGAVKTGAIVTAARNTFAGFVDYLYTGKTVVDGYQVLGRYNADTSFFDTESNVLTDDWGLLRYRRTGALGTGGVFEMSVSTGAGPVRIWTSIGGGSGAVAGIDKQVQYNKTGAFAADGNLTWDYTNQVMTLTGLVGTAGIAVATAYVQSDGGFLVTNTNTSYNSVQSTGGMAARSFTAIKYIQVGQSAGVPTVSTSDTFNNGSIYYDTGSSQLRALIAGVWTSIAGTGGGAAGINQQVQYNNAGVFGASSHFTFDGGTCFCDNFGVINTGSYYAKDTGGTYRAILTLHNDNNLYLDNVNNSNDIYIRPASGRFLILGNTTGALLPNGTTTVGTPPTIVNGVITVAGTPWADGYFTGLRLGGLTLVANGPFWQMDNTAGAANEKLWFPMVVAGNTLVSYVTADNNTGPAIWMDVKRSGNSIVQIDFPSAGHFLIGTSTDDGSGHTVQVTGSLSASAGLYTASAAVNSIQSPSGGMQAQTFNALGSVYNSIQAASGGMTARSFTAAVYIQAGQNFGVPSATTFDTLHNGSIFYDTSINQLRALIAGVWTSLSGGSGSGVPSISGTANQVLVNGGTGAVTTAATLSLPSTVVTGAFQATASGSTNAFIAGGGLFVITGNGNLTTLGAIASTSYKIGGTTVINGSSQFVGNGVDVGASGISCGGYSIQGGFNGQTVTKTVSDGVSTFQLFFKGGILYGFT